ncbi:hypothetical protein [Blastococcus sp. SYSU DS0619]
MSERNGSTAAGPGTAEIPVVRPAAPATETAPPVPEPATAPTSAPTSEAATAPEGAAGPAGEGDDVVPGMHPTAPVSSRPRPRMPRMPRRGPLTVMGPWAPVAGGLLGLLVGLIVVLVLGGSADVFEDRLALAFAVVGLSLLGAAGVLLADEVRIVRQRAREAGVRPQWVESTATLVNGLTPARLLLLVSAFVLFLSAYVSRG